MKKYILTAVAAGAMAIGGAASAQDLFGLGNVLPQIFGLGGHSTGSQPAVVAGAQSQIYVDQFGRRVAIDQYGRQVLLDQHAGTTGRIAYDQYGRQIMLDQYGTYVDRFGRRMHVDSYGRHVRLDRYGTYRDQWGRTVYLGPDRRPLYVEQNGQLYAVGGSWGSNIAYGSRVGDRDGDGVPDIYDRYPDDPRYR